VSQPTEKTEADILPDAELNPLLNPLLAGNMGRWAEVYFTTPPEKRGQAISDLVRELQSKPSTESSSAGRPPEQKPATEEMLGKHDGPAKQVRQPWSTIEEPQRTCPACSAKNPMRQRFCGMCGAALQSLPESNESSFRSNPAVSEEPEANEDESWGESESSSGDQSPEYHADANPNRGDHARAASFEPEWRVSESDLPHFAQESESAPYQLRLYIGIAVALILAGLVYMKWHGTPGSGDISQSAPSRVIPDAPPSAPPPVTPEPASSRNVLPTERSPAAATSNPATAPRASEAGVMERQNQMETTAHQAQPAKARPVPPAIPAAAGSSTIANGQGGAEELATAEQYLNRNHPGAAGDNREAAQWLWKAVGKGNATATLVLSDLYLRGDGIPKNCDQARLLLDLAARKGKTSAAERLRNLQAFGCQ
jgi:hypothetical protein